MCGKEKTQIACCEGEWTYSLAIKNSTKVIQDLCNTCLKQKIPCKANWNCPIFTSQQLAKWLFPQAYALAVHPSGQQCQLKGAYHYSVEHHFKHEEKRPFFALIHPVNSSVLHTGIERQERFPLLPNHEFLKSIVLFLRTWQILAILGD